MKETDDERTGVRYSRESSVQGNEARPVGSESDQLPETRLGKNREVRVKQGHKGEGEPRKERRTP